MIKSFALIPLSQGLFATIDLEDLGRVGQFHWTADVQRKKNGSTLEYAARRVQLPNGIWTKEYLHRFLLGAKPGEHCDHISGDGLDNRRHNVRICTQAENVRNKSPQRGGSSQYKGVHWHTQNDRWQARIQVDGKQLHLGYFVDETDAARAYDKAALEYFGEFARLNFPIPNQR